MKMLRPTVTCCRVWEISRRNRRLKHMYQKLEKKIEKQNAYGVKDLTAYNAVERIRTGGRATIVLK